MATSPPTKGLQNAPSQLPSYYQPHPPPLRVSSILNNILHVQNEVKQLSEDFRLGLSQRSIPERHQIRSFARLLCCVCDDLGDATPDRTNQGNDVNIGEEEPQPAVKPEITVRAEPSFEAEPTVFELRHVAKPGPGIEPRTTEPGVPTQKGSGDGYPLKQSDDVWVDEILQVKAGNKSASSEHVQLICVDDKRSSQVEFEPAVGYEPSVELESATANQPAVEPESTTKHELAIQHEPPAEPEPTTELEPAVEVKPESEPESEPELTELGASSDILHANFKCTGTEDQPRYVNGIDEAFGSPSDLFDTPTSAPARLEHDGLRAHAAASSAFLNDTTPVPGSPGEIPAFEPMTPERTISPTSLSRVRPAVQADKSERGCLELLDQSTEDFVNNAYEQIQRFSLATISPETYTAVFHSLKSTAGQMETKWSDGTQWASLAEETFSEQQKVSIRSALTAIAYTRWHESQVRLLDPSMGRTNIHEVAGRVLGPKPKDDAFKRGWDQRRKSLNRYRSRGRKWALLVEKLGFGILFKKVW
ncbi:hypothetical protein QQZ08_009522 [Neonectria magnoliae]|uniref:Uncharacterized protein n=1 Tax=Neonectria magnoliae TaxID=2732573 RepID=A0ABR1HMK4_9HYPO